MKIFAYILLTFMSLYWFLPSLWYRVLSKSTVKSVSGQNVSITFDDGPTNTVTPQVLEILREHQVTVTFFVLGSFAKDYPDLVKAQLEDSHHIGLHGMNHRCHWFMGPVATFRDIVDSKTTIESLGGKPVLFRPPWGLYNLFTVMACRYYGLNWVHWSLHTSDWDKKTTVDQRINTISNRVKSGDIILLHDGRGDQGAAENTACALPDILKVLENNKLKCTPLSNTDV